MSWSPLALERANELTSTFEGECAFSSRDSARVVFCFRVLRSGPRLGKGEILSRRVRHGWAGQLLDARFCAGGTDLAECPALAVWRRMMRVGHTSRSPEVRPLEGNKLVVDSLLVIRALKCRVCPRVDLERQSSEKRSKRDCGEFTGEEAGSASLLVLSFS